MVESDGKLYVVYSKFYHDVIDGNRTDLGIQLTEIELAGRLPELGKPVELGTFALPGAIGQPPGGVLGGALNASLPAGGAPQGGATTDAAVAAATAAATAGRSGGRAKGARCAACWPDRMVALTVHPVALSVYHVALNIHHVALSIHNVALNVHHVALSVHTM
eukprot:1188023-Prorocentrum_minimum.AAC.2